jgi:hypothetical protein
MDDLEDRLLDSIVKRYGYLVGSAGLRAALGFSSQGALRHAITQGTLPVPVFTVEGRKGPFAKAHDLARWLSAQPDVDRLIAGPRASTGPATSEGAPAHVDGCKDAV